MEDPKQVEAACEGRENYMKKLKGRLLKDNQLVQITLKDFLDYFQQDLNNPVSIRTLIQQLYILYGKARA